MAYTKKVAIATGVAQFDGTAGKGEFKFGMNPTGFRVRRILIDFGAAPVAGEYTVYLCEERTDKAFPLKAETGLSVRYVAIYDLEIALMPNEYLKIISVNKPNATGTIEVIASEGTD